MPKPRRLFDEDSHEWDIPALIKTAKKHDVSTALIVRALLAYDEFACDPAHQHDPPGPLMAARLGIDGNLAIDYVVDYILSADWFTKPEGKSGTLGGTAAD